MPASPAPKPAITAPHEPCLPCFQGVSNHTCDPIMAAFGVRERTRVEIAELELVVSYLDQIIAESESVG